MINKRTLRRKKIKYRIRKKISGTGSVPRLCVYRSNKGFYAQIIDDVKGNTLLSASYMHEDIVSQKVTKIEQAKLVGKLLASNCLSSGIKKVKFDRSGYIYHGRVKAFAEAAREGGLQI